VFISDLFYNFLNTIESIRQFLGVEWIRDPVELLPYHKINISNQQYKNQDIIATQILQSVINNVNLRWNASDITLYTEAFIQRALQQQDIMLQCNGLNVFPTSTNELIEVFE
jgi:pyruvate kinase